MTKDISILKRIRYDIRKINHYKNLLLDHSPKLLILVYHRVIPYVRFNPFNTIITYDTFIRQLDSLANNFSVISLDDAIRQCQNGKADAKTQVILTFDDGFKDNYEVVFPVLKQKGLPATFFIVPGLIDKEALLWDYEVVKILYNNKEIRRIKIGKKTIFHKVMQPRLYFILSVIEEMKHLSSESIRRILEKLKENPESEDIYNYSDDKCMTWKQVREMSDSGMEIGAHSLTHRSLARIHFKEAIEEIVEGKEIIENNLKKECQHFAFPFGSIKDFNQELINCIKNAGFKSCLLNIHGYNHYKKNLFYFKRIIMEENTDPNYLLG